MNCSVISANIPTNICFSYSIWHSAVAWPPAQGRLEDRLRRIGVLYVQRSVAQYRLAYRLFGARLSYLIRQINRDGIALEDAHPFTRDSAAVIGLLPTMAIRAAIGR